MTTAGLGDIARLDLMRTGLRALVSAAGLLLLYFLVPVESRPHESVALRLAVALAFFIAVLSAEVRSISRHDHPMLRAGIAMATVIPLFIVLFAWLYLTMSLSDPGAFGQGLTRVNSLYFTVTVFSTVGFGDITPKSDAARLVCTVQMLADLAVIAVVVRLILGAATREVARRTSPGSA